MKTANDDTFKEYNLNDTLDFLRAMALSVEAQEENKKDWIDKEAERLSKLKK